MIRERADVVIIGGGVIGLSVAYYAASKGADVILLEKGELGSGSSSGNAGLVVPSHFEPLQTPGNIRESLTHMFDPASFFGVKPRLDLTFLYWLTRFGLSCSKRHYDYAIHAISSLNRESLNAHFELAQSAHGEYEFVQRGMLMLCLDSARLQEARKMSARARSVGVEARQVSRSEVVHMEPNVGKRVVGGVYFRDDARLEPALFLRWLARQLETRKVRVFPQTEVYDFRKTGNRLQTILTTKGEFKAEQIVLAAGAWLNSLGHVLGVRLPIEGGKGISLTFHHPDTSVRLPLILDEHHVAVSPFSGALRLTGVLELAGLDMTLKPKRVNGILRSTRRYLPMIEHMTPDVIWRGLRPCTPDGLPLIGRLKTLKNVLVAGGHDMKGVSLGPVTGKYVAKLLGGESLGEMEKTLSPNRF